MSDPNRRSFLKHAAAASAGTAALAWTGGINAAGANERLTIGMIGCGGRGAGLADEFAGIADIAYVCDPDESRRRQAGKGSCQARGGRPAAHPGRQVGGRRSDRHSGALARSGRHSGLRRRQTRVRGEAVQPQRA